MKRKAFNWLLSLLILLALFLCLLFPVKADFSGKNYDWFKAFQDLCVREPAECAPYDDDRTEVKITPERSKILDEVNSAVNRATTYRTDIEHYGKPDYFTYPTDGYGDCEDYALEKRRRLVAMGWPRRALLLMVVDDPEFHKHSAKPELHMVMVLHTDKGDLILDMETNVIRFIGDTPYEPIWIQSDTDPSTFDNASLAKAKTQ